MVEFAINASTSRTTGLAPFELNGTMPRMMGSMDAKESVPGVRQFMQQVQDNLLAAHDAIIESRINQTHFANRRRRDEGNELEGYTIEEGELAYLSTKNLSLPKG